MFAHNTRLQYTVRVRESNPGLANLMLEQFGGPQGELAAACRYFTQYLGEEDPGRKDMLIDIATEELSHLEVIGTMVAVLNRSAKGRSAEGVDEAADMYRDISGGGNGSHVTQVLYGGGPPLTNSGGVPWTAAYVDTIGDPTCDLRSNIAAESRAKIVYRAADQSHGRSRGEGSSRVLDDAPRSPISNRSRRRFIRFSPTSPPGRAGRHA